MFRFWRGAPEARPQASDLGPQGEPEPPLEQREPLRPPGAVFEELFVDKCTRCGKCVEACPRHAIFALDDSYGRAKGTPAIFPRYAPCVVCEGLQCTKVCPSKSLSRIAPFDIQMGTAVVEDTCVTHAGTACDVCVKACPIPGAIAADAQGRPIVDAVRCVGCGVCENVCPTENPSIYVEPAREICR